MAPTEEISIPPQIDQVIHGKISVSEFRSYVNSLGGSAPRKLVPLLFYPKYAPVAATALTYLARGSSYENPMSKDSVIDEGEAHIRAFRESIVALRIIYPAWEVDSEGIEQMILKEDFKSATDAMIRSLPNEKSK